jgi:hypothetical protein
MIPIDEACLLYLPCLCSCCFSHTTGTYIGNRFMISVAFFVCVHSRSTALDIRSTMSHNHMPSYCLDSGER